MDEVVSELQACLAELEAKDGGEATMIVRAPVARPERPARVRRERRRPALLLPLLLAALLLAAVVGAVLVLGGGGDGEGGADQGAPPVALQGVGAYDPEGGDGEHDAEAPLATDGNASTYWTTSSYRASLEAIGKSGVGLVVSAGDAGELSRLAVSTDTPGFRAEIRAGDSAQGPFERVVGQSKAVGPSTTWELEGADAPYYAIWITELDGRAHVNEVEAS
jgi:hypothetical protein